MAVECAHLPRSGLDGLHRRRAWRRKSVRIRLSITIHSGLAGQFQVVCFRCQAPDSIEILRRTSGRRVNVDGPGDDPDEYWFECDDCEGTGTVNVPDGHDVSTSFGTA